MRRKVAILSGLILLAICMTAALKVTQETWKDKVSIQSRAHKAKGEGKTNVTLLGPVAEYPGMGMSLDIALQRYSAVVAEVVETNTYLSDADVINTAYKFRILDSITQKDAVLCDTCPPLRDVSEKLHPAFSNEFLLELSGGTLIVDGVKVRMTNTAGLEFEARKKYLLFISFTPGGMARLAAGPVGVFRVRDDDVLESVGNSDYPIPDQISTRHSKKLTKFKQDIKGL
jgi:hypothetical protein